MSAWQKQLDELKREASNATTEIRELTPEMKRLIDEAKSSRGADPDEVAQATASLQPTLRERVVLGMRVVMSRHATPHGTKWALSISPHPRGRVCTVGDEENRRRIAKQVGARGKPTTLGSAVLHWIWTEDA